MEDDFMDWETPKEKEEEIHICENEGCSHRGFACRLIGDYNEGTKTFDEDHIEYLCGKHARDEGYCVGCGEFIAGTGMEFRNNGYCDNCYDEIRSAESDDEEDYDEMDIPDDYDQLTDDDEDYDSKCEDNNPNDSRNI